MRMTLLMLALLSLGACSMRDTVNMDQPTTQVFDLNDPDRDGVIEARERCAGTMMGAAIDNYGCGDIKTINERREVKVLFPNDSSYLAPQYFGQIEELASFMRQFPNTKVTIEGHCSRTGGYDYNMELSQRRANAVTDVLTQQYGIDSGRLKAVGFGYNNPVDPSDTPEAHDKNRRVIAEIVGDDTTADMKWHIYTVDQEVK
ncbi:MULTISPECIES: OmpA family protein [Shewanella]|uniref:OmpA family protein n=1 Tax=Shewanella TaxID=22 RepID=UPI001C65DE30|nr:MULTISPECIES: OmpA family protein [Shewanella]QYJ75013.1 OmpA family protein [Shewanella sp. FJAT-52076]QYK04887.1 OmpA family protein [Shewanella zhangzhouensis]